MDGVRAGRITVLFVSPEKLLSSAFQALIAELPAPGLAMVCVDEAHCVSQVTLTERAVCGLKGMVG